MTQLRRYGWVILLLAAFGCTEEEPWFGGPYKGTGEDVAYINEYDEGVLASSEFWYAFTYSNITANLADNEGDVIFIFQRGFEVSYLKAYVVGKRLIVPEQAANQYQERVSGYGDFSEEGLSLHLTFTDRFVNSHYYTYFTATLQKL